MARSLPAGAVSCRARWPPRWTKRRSTPTISRPTLAYDLHTERGSRNAWAEAHLVAALQGLVNRQHPRLYITYVTGDTGKPGGMDRFWLDQLRAPGGWLARTPLQPLPTLESLVQTFRPHIKGVVLYDLRVPATSNVASTAAGCEDLLPDPL